MSATAIMAVNKLITQQIRELVTDESEDFAFDAARKYGLDFEYCSKCNNTVPADDHKCVICGTQTAAK